MADRINASRRLSRFARNFFIESFLAIRSPNFLCMPVGHTSLANLPFRDSPIHRTEFGNRGCQIVEAKFTKSPLKDIEFTLVDQQGRLHILFCEIPPISLKSKPIQR